MRGWLGLFKYELNPVRKAGVCETTGLVHGNLYKLAGTFDLKERNMKWAYSIVDWVPRTTDVNVERKLFVSYAVEDYDAE